MRRIPGHRPISPPPPSLSCSSAAAGNPRAKQQRREGAMQQRGEFRVSVAKDYLVFASAHFITFAGHRCEGLHGHNYRVRVTVEGALDQDTWFVFDFVVLKRLMKDLCDEIDHKVLLPLENPKIQVTEEGDAV